MSGTSEVLPSAWESASPQEREEIAAGLVEAWPRSYGHIDLVEAALGAPAHSRTVLELPISVEGTRVFLRLSGNEGVARRWRIVGRSLQVPYRVDVGTKPREFLEARGADSCEQVLVEQESLWRQDLDAERLHEVAGRICSESAIPMDEISSLVTHSEYDSVTSYYPLGGGDVSALVVVHGLDGVVVDMYQLGPLDDD